MRAYVLWASLAVTGCEWVADPLSFTTEAVPIWQANAKHAAPPENPTSLRVMAWNVKYGARRSAPPISPLIITAHLGLDIAVFKRSRITLGVLYANYDQGATRVVIGSDEFAQRVRERSNNILPTLDFTWAGH